MVGQRNNSTLTSSQLQEFRGLINSDQLDAAFEYLKSKIRDPDKRRRRRKGKYDDDLISGYDS